MNRWRAIVALCGFGLAGCALTSIGDGLEQSSCIGEPLSFCNELNEIAPVTNSELSWSCNVASGVCEVQELDGDGDGSGVRLDCDDSDPLRAPGKVEYCDNIDNDCDEKIDEDSYALVDSQVPALTEDTNVIFDSFSLAQNPDTLETLILYQRDKVGTPDLVGALLSSPDALVSKQGIVNAMPSLAPQSLAVVHVGDNQYEAAIASGSGLGTRPIDQGTLDIQSAGARLSFMSDLQQRVVGTGLSALAISAGSTGDFVIGAFQARNPSPSDGCGAIASAPDNLEAIHLYNAHANLEDAPPVILGRTGDPSQVAFVPLGARQWLVAFANGESTGLSIRQVSIQTGGGSAALDAPSADVSAEQVTGEVALAISDDGTKVAASARVGCGASDLLLAFFDRDPATGDLTQTQTTSPARTTTKANPSLIWHSLPSPGWILAYEEEASRSLLAFFDSAGSEIGAKVLVAEDSGSGTRKSGTHLLRAEGDDFALVSPIFGATTPSQIRVSTVQCVPNPNL